MVKKQTTIKPKEKEAKIAKPKKTVKPEKKIIKKDIKISYFEGIGRRKKAIARVRLFVKGQQGFFINGKELKHYLPLIEKQKIINEPLELTGNKDLFGVSVNVKGGGISSQAEAIRHGISRALIKFNSEFRKQLKKAGFLTRDPRMRERKKFGLKRARRAPQWSKR